MDSIKLLKKRINSVANKILETNILGGDGQGAEVPDAGLLVQEMPSVSEIDRQFEEFMVCSPVLSFSHCHRLERH